MIVRPFKVAFCDIKNNYGNTKTNDIDNVMKEIITTVFNKSIEIEILKISQSESFFHLLTSFSKNNNIFEYKKVQKLKSDLLEENQDDEDLEFADTIYVPKYEFGNNIALVERYKYLINELDIYRKEHKSSDLDFYHEFVDFKNKEEKNVSRIVSIRDSLGRTVKKYFEDMSASNFLYNRDISFNDTYQYFKICQPIALSDEEFNEFKRLMMTAYDKDSDALYTLNYTDADIIKAYLINYKFDNSDYEFLDTLLDDNIPKSWYQEEILINSNIFIVNLKLVGEHWINGNISGKSLIELLNRSELDVVKSDVIDILSKYGLNINELIDISREFIENIYLNIDRDRANMQGENQTILYDPNRGHWEVFEDYIEYSFREDTTSDNGFYARNPVLDIKDGAVCAIDFGTKSTVVAIRDQEERLVRIGTGDYYSEVRATDYENPTTIYFDDFLSFINAYESRVGRPFTLWKDLKISHEAEQRFYNDITNEDNFYATFNELKQWANDPLRYQIIRDRKGKEIKLVPYKKLGTDNKFDPIELYAYYLGLYINNMNNGIYLNYVLSFPVNYGKEVQDRLLNSFTKGLKKSLPSSILANDEVMEDFEVYAGASEPAAYAITALEKYSLEPSNDDEVAYGVFDFGGGTTDYDFGIERKPSDGRRRFELTQFGKGGDPYLGGENLLQLMAYKVYCENKLEMLKNRIPIVLPQKASRIPGFEVLVMDHDIATKEAYSNMRVLMHLLRPIWEEAKGAEEEFNEESKVVRLFSSDSSDMKGIDITLKINIDDLKSLLKEHISIGVQNFISQMHAVFKKKDLKTYPIHVFLAGNSCKSTILQEIFIDFLVKSIKEFITTHDEQPDVEKLELYKLYPPLGIQFDIGSIKKSFHDDDLTILNQLLVVSTNIEESDRDIPSDQKRTGKTGVVFGLLRSRKGGKDVRIINENLTDIDEIKFPFYLGVEGDNRMFKTVISIDIPYNTWAPFDWADEKRFELYYTVDNRALYDNTLPISETSLKVCKIDKSDINEDHKIFIRKAGINIIEYVIANSDFNGDTTNLNVYSNVILG